MVVGGVFPTKLTTRWCDAWRVALANENRLASDQSLVIAANVALHCLTLHLSLT